MRGLEFCAWLVTMSLLGIAFLVATSRCNGF